MDDFLARNQITQAERRIYYGNLKGNTNFKHVSEVFADLQQYIKNSTTIVWNRIDATTRTKVVTSGRNIFGVPMDLVNLVLVHNPDLVHLLSGISWSEYLAKIAELSSQDRDGDGIPDKAFCLNRVSGVDYGGEIHLLQYVLKSFFPQNGAQTGWLFDATSMTSYVDTDAMAEAIRIVGGLRRYANKAISAYEIGTCVMMFSPLGSWGGGPAALTSVGSPLVHNSKTGHLDRLDPHLVNEAKSVSVSGFYFTIAQGSMHKDEAFKLIEFFQEPFVARTFVVQGIANPWNMDQFNSSLWRETVEILRGSTGTTELSGGRPLLTKFGAKVLSGFNADRSMAWLMEAKRKLLIEGGSTYDDMYFGYYRSSWWLGYLVITWSFLPGILFSELWQDVNSLEAVLTAWAAEANNYALSERKETALALNQFREFHSLTTLCRLGRQKITSCPDGYYSLSPDASSCIPCPAGFYGQNETCFKCPLGRYAERRRSPTCDFCQNRDDIQFTTTGEASTSSDNCTPTVDVRPSYPDTRVDVFLVVDAFSSPDEENKEVFVNIVVAMTWRDDRLSGRAPNGTEFTMAQWGKRGFWSPSFTISNVVKKSIVVDRITCTTFLGAQGTRIVYIQRYVEIAATLSWPSMDWKMFPFGMQRLRITLSCELGATCMCNECPVLNRRLRIDDEAVGGDGAACLQDILRNQGRRIASQLRTNYHAALNVGATNNGAMGSSLLGSQVPLHGGSITKQADSEWPAAWRLMEAVFETAPLGGPVTISILVKRSPNLILIRSVFPMFALLCLTLATFLAQDTYAQLGHGFMTLLIFMVCADQIKQLLPSHVSYMTWLDYFVLGNLLIMITATGGALIIIVLGETGRDALANAVDAAVFWSQLFFAMLLNILMLTVIDETNAVSMFSVMLSCQVGGVHVLFAIILVVYRNKGLATRLSVRKVRLSEIDRPSHRLSSLSARNALTSKVGLDSFCVSSQPNDGSPNQQSVLNEDPPMASFQENPDEYPRILASRIGKGLPGAAWPPSTDDACDEEFIETSPVLDEHPRILASRNGKGLLDDVRPPSTVDARFEFFRETSPGEIHPHFSWRDFDCAGETTV